MTLMPLTAFTGSQPDFDELASLIQRVKNETGHPSGTAIALVKNGKVVYEGYFGYADIDAGKRIDRNTVFYIASATKPFLALDALLEQSAGRLDTRDSLQEMFPDVHFNGFDASAVTIGNLLTHTSGIDNDPLVWATAFSGIHDASSRYRLVANSYPDETAPLGTFKYTNVGYNILSIWLDRQFASPWQTQLDRNVFSPLRMERTSAFISEAHDNGWQLARPYSMQSIDPNVPLYLEKSDQTMQAAGGMISTAPDLARFLIAQLHSGKVGRKQIFPASVIAASHVQQAATDASYLDFNRTGYARGWYTGEYKGRQMLHHFGAFPGFHAHLSFIPEADVGLVVLNNEDFLSARLTSLIADYAYGLLLDEPDIDARAHTRFDDLLEKAKGLKQAATKQREKIQGRAWNLSLPREAYAGTYSNELLGDMTVTMDRDQQLIVSWGRLSSAATAFEGADQVRVEFAPNSGNVLAFSIKGDAVDALHFEKMTFTRER